MQRLESGYSDFVEGRRHPANEDEGSMLGILALQCRAPALALQWLEPVAAAAKTADVKTETARRLLMARAQLLEHCLASKPVDADAVRGHLGSARSVFAGVLEVLDPSLGAETARERRRCATGWLRIDELAPLREASRHPSLPDAEREAWSAFWATVEAIAGGKQ